MRKLSAFNIAALVLGIGFLYLPIVILVVYSFNASLLVAVVGGWVDALVCRAGQSRAAAPSRIDQLSGGLHLGVHRDVLGHARRGGAGPVRPLSRPAAVRRDDLCAIGHARGHYWPVHAAS